MMSTVTGRTITAVRKDHYGDRVIVALDNGTSLVVSGEGVGWEVESHEETLRHAREDQGHRERDRVRNLTRDAKRVKKQRAVAGMTREQVEAWRDLHEPGWRQREAMRSQWNCQTYGYGLPVASAMSPPPASTYVDALR